MTRISLSPFGTAREAFSAAGDRWQDWVGTVALAAVGEERAFFAWELARIPDGLVGEERRGLLLLVLASLEGLAEGSTRMPLDASPLAARLVRLGASPRELSLIVDLIAEAASPGAGRLAPIVGRGSDFRPLILEDGALVHQRLRCLEERLATALAGRLGRAPFVLPRDRAAAAVLAVSRFGSVVLSDRQREAVWTALHQPLAVISGGPGTGKTALLVAILRALVRLSVAPVDIALAAPTGKAADRMRQAIQRGLGGAPVRDESDLDLAESLPEPRTLHRLLGYSPATNRFHHHEHNCLSARVIIVDECSMIDLALMDRLVRATREDARLVLVGDADQLPSVEAGAVFRDVVTLGRGVVLADNYRASMDAGGRQVLAASARILQGGDGIDDAAVARAGAGALLLDGVELLEGGSTSRRELLERWFQEHARPPALAPLRNKVYRIEEGGFSPKDAADISTLLAHLEDHRILCVTREHPGTGAEAVCQFLHAAALAETRTGAILAGEPVMMQRNDYDRRLWNGDQGVVVKVAKDGHGIQPMAVFARPEGLVAFPLAGLGADLQLSYAITVHKAQGSEYESVALLLPEVDVPILSREILYTAVTRARRSVVIQGSREILRLACERVVTRHSGVAARLAVQLDRMGVT